MFAPHHFEGSPVLSHLGLPAGLATVLEPATNEFLAVYAGLLLGQTEELVDNPLYLDDATYVAFCEARFSLALALVEMADALRSCMTRPSKRSAASAGNGEGGDEPTVDAVAGIEIDVDAFEARIRAVHQLKDFVERRLAEILDTIADYVEKEETAALALLTGEVSESADQETGVTGVASTATDAGTGPEGPRSSLLERVALGQLRPPRLPRLVRLGASLGLSAKEQFALEIVLAYNLGHEFPLHSTSMSDVVTTRRTIASMTGMTSAEVLSFLDPQRIHMSQAVFERVTEDATSFGRNFAMTATVVSALLGRPLTDDDILKLDKTELGNVIMSEPDFASHPFGAMAGGGGGSGNPGTSLGGDGLGGGPADGQDLADYIGQINADLAATATALDDPGVQAAVNYTPEDDGREGLDVYSLLKATGMDDATIAGVMAGDGDGSDDEDGDGGGGEGSSETGTLASTVAMGSGGSSITAYTNDLEYLDDMFQLIATKIKFHQLDSQDEENVTAFRGYNERPPEVKARETESKMRMLQSKVDARLRLTRDRGVWVPRLERLGQLRGLDRFAKTIILTLIGGIVSNDVRNAVSSGNPYSSYVGGSHSQSFTVGALLTTFCKTLRDQVACRKYFYKSSALVSEGIIRIGENLATDLMDCSVDIDRRMVDYVVGLETEFGELVEGSYLYTPTVAIDQVVLPAHTKTLIVDTVTNFEVFKEQRKRLGFDSTITYGNGVVMMFYGPSGTGKTMMAQALAASLGKKLLSITFSSVDHTNNEMLKFILREGKINNAIVFFDECEGLFETRRNANSTVHSILTEIERHDGLIVMATNRAHELDEAMYRRISVSVEFKAPGPSLRERIWAAHWPADMDDSEIDWRKIARSFELTGGFIKNAILSALSIAISRDRDNIRITQSDVEDGARLQLQGRLQMREFDRRLVPRNGMDALVVPDSVRERLLEIIAFEKSRKVLFGQWGFEMSMMSSAGTVALLAGPPGTGKTLAAEAIAWEIGKPLKMINSSELLSKYVGESGKNIDKVFKNAQDVDALLVFDECEGLLGTRTDQSSSTDRYANMDVQSFLYHLEHFPGVVLLTTNMLRQIDEAFFRRFRFVIEFPAPTATLRASLWEKLLPSKAPLADDIDFGRLSELYDFCGGSIRNSIIKAASRAALRDDEEQVIRMDDLVKAGEEELVQLNGHDGAGQYAMMYN